MHSLLEGHLESGQHIACFLFECLVVRLVGPHVADKILDHPRISISMAVLSARVVGYGAVKHVAAWPRTLQQSSIYQSVKYLHGGAAHCYCCLFRKTVRFRGKS